MNGRSIGTDDIPLIVLKSENISHERYLKVMGIRKKKLSDATGCFKPMPSDYISLKKQVRKGILDDERESIWKYIILYNIDEIIDMATANASYKAALQEVFGKSLGEKGHLFPPNFGGVSDLGDHSLTTTGERSFSCLSLVFQQLNALGYCPSILDMIPIFLLYMTEAQTYLLISAIFKYQRKNNRYEDQVLRKIQTNYSADISLVRAFKKGLQWRYADIVNGMLKCDAYDDRYFLLIFTRLFTGFLPMPVVLRIIDSFLLEGTKVFCRIMMACFKLSKSELKAISSNGPEWWEDFKGIMNRPGYDYDELLRIAFRWRYGILFKRAKIQAMHVELKKDLDVQERAASYGQHHPLEIINPENTRLLDPHRDFFFRSWLPSTIQTRKLKLVYSAEVHGRGLDTMYLHCRGEKSDTPMLILIEALGTDTIIGAFTSHRLVHRKSFFGNSKTFVFRLQPYPQRFKYPLCTDDDSHIISPTNSSSSGFSGTSIMSPAPSPRRPRQSRHSRHSGYNGTEEEVGRSEFLLCLREFLSIGIDKKSNASIRLNFDLTKGSSDSCDAFINPPLISEECREFEIGGIEVFEFLELSS